MKDTVFNMDCRTVHGGSLGYGYSEVTTRRVAEILYFIFIKIQRMPSIGSTLKCLVDRSFAGSHDVFFMHQ